MNGEVHPAKKVKTSLACEACRKRKTRCDGERPACSYCRTTGVVCLYRPGAGPSLTNEQTLLDRPNLLDRLDRIEAQLNSLGRQQHFENSKVNPEVNRTPYFVPPGVYPQTTTCNDTSNSQDKDGSYVMTPFFHTACSHKMLHYWPTLNLNLTLPHCNPLRYVEETVEGGLPPLVASYRLIVDANVIFAQLKEMYERSMGVDLIFCHFLQRHSNILNRLLDLFASQTEQTRLPTSSQPTASNTVDISQFDCQSLLVINLATRGPFGATQDDNYIDKVETIQAHSFTCANFKTSELFFLSDEDSIPFLILGAHMLMSATYPVGALKLVQAAGDRLRRCGRMQTAHEVWNAKLQDCLKLHHIVESDILLTMDGVPSDVTFLSSMRVPYSRILQDAETSYMNISTEDIARKKLMELFFDAVNTLCNLQNKLLTQLYAIEQAYMPPSVLASPLVELKAELGHWFENLPVDWHFPRDLSGATSIPNHAPEVFEYLRMRYYILEFLMCRPILYYIAHETFEESLGDDHATIQTNSTDSTSHPFWVYDACYRCLQCAGLLIINKDMGPEDTRTQHRDWVQLHMIWGAALTLVLANSSPALARFLPKYGPNMDSWDLVTKARLILEQFAVQSSIVQSCVRILDNVKENLSHNNAASV